MNLHVQSKNHSIFGRILFFAFMFFVCFLFLSFRELKSFSVKFINIEIELFREEAIGCNFEQLHRVESIFSHIHREMFEIVLIAGDKAYNFISYSIDDSKAIFFCFDQLEFHVFYFFYYVVIYLHKFLNNAVVFQLQHDLDKLSKLFGIFRVVDIFIEELFEI